MNGPHPLVESYVRGNPDVCAVEILPAAGTPAQRNTILRRLGDQASQFSNEIAGMGVALGAGFEDQVAIEVAENFDLLFLHTTPHYLGTRPFVFHFESLPSLFAPWLATGSTRGCPLKAFDFFWHVHCALESPNCRKIFSHIRDSLAILQRVFNSCAITPKLHHVPIGIDAKGVTKPGGALRILFTNSLHRNPQSFYLRGGHHLLEAVQRTPHVELTIVSSVPEDIFTRFPRMDRVTWVYEHIDDAALDELFAAAHVFALPAAGLHSHSLLRAMAHGCVPLVSDAPGYSEYTAELDVMRLRGVFDLIYRHEPDGWLSDRYEPYYRPIPALVEQIVAQIADASPATLRERGHAVLEHCRCNYSVAASQAAFNRMLLAA